MPKVSVIMSCYNESANVSDAIRSILDQTFKDFEFIIVDDGSHDDTLQVVRKNALSDSRVVVIENHENIGLAASLNKAIKKAKGKYIARMDADDVSLPNRLAEQMEYLEKNPSTDVLGSNAFLISDTQEIISDLPLSNQEIYANRYKRTFLIHPTVMIRQEIFKRHGTYNDDLIWAEDKDLWLRWMGKDNSTDGPTFANLAKPLLRYKVKEKINIRIFYYNHYVLITNMLRRGELLPNVHLLFQSVLSHFIKMIRIK